MTLNPGPYADHYMGGSIPPKVDLLRDKEIIQRMGFRSSPFALLVFLPNLVLKSKFQFKVKFSAGYY